MAHHDYRICDCCICLEAKERQAQFVRDTMGFSPSAQTLELTKPGFYLVWVPLAPQTPRKRYASEAEAQEAAASLVNDGCTEVFVLKAVQRVGTTKSVNIEKLS